MMKRIFAFILSALLLMGLLGCAGQPETNTAPTETTQPTPTESAEEAEVLKIMILGSSRSVNTFQLLYEAFRDQLPDQKLVLGIMYYSGCSMTMHTNFIKNNECVYDYYRNTDGRWEIQSNSHMAVGLQDQKWDVVLLQAGNGDLDNEMNKPCREFLTQYVDSILGDHPHTFWWHSTWTNSTDPALYDPAKTKINPLTVDQYGQLTSGIDAAKAYVMEDPMFEGRITSGTPMMYALKVLEIPEAELYRDHTHLSDFGCLLVAYAWYAQYTGNPVTQINLDMIPQHLRHWSYQHLGDMVVTQEMKDQIIQTVDYTLKNPWSVPLKDE